MALPVKVTAHSRRASQSGEQAVYGFGKREVAVQLQGMLERLVIHELASASLG